MDRRQAIQTILTATASTVFFTGCGEAQVIEFLKDGQLDLNSRHMDYLAAISESILPLKGVSDKIESPVNFIMRMINDCRTPDDVSMFATGFDQYKSLMNEANTKMVLADANKAVELIKASLALEEPQKELVYFLTETKQLSIQNLKTSAFYLTTKTDYQLIPELYQACVDI